MPSEDRAEMLAAIREGRCYITVDGWCATHSTGDGPVYHDEGDTPPTSP